MRTEESLAKTGDDDEGFSGFGGDYADVLKSAHNTGACDTPTRVSRMPSTGQVFVIKVSSLAHGNGRCMSFGGGATYRADRQRRGGILRTQRVPGKIKRKTLRGRLLCSKRILVGRSCVFVKLCETWYSRPSPNLFIASRHTFCLNSRTAGNYESCLLGPSVLAETRTLHPNSRHLCQ